MRLPKVMKYPFLLFMLLTAGSLLAQEDYRDVIYLKDGSVVKGIINRQVPGESIVLQIGEDSTTQYALGDVDHIRRERLKTDKPKGIFILDSIPPRSLAAAIEAGALFGFKANDENGRFYNYSNRFFTLSAVFGYRLSRKLFLGAGAGFEIDTRKYTQVPIFANLRYTFLHKRVSPFIDQKFGAAFLILPVNKNYRNDGGPIGGATLQTQLGVRVYATNRVQLGLSALYRFQHFRGNILVNETYRLNYYSAAHYLGFTAGIIF